MTVPGDWDFSSVSWALDSGIYVSAPSSIKVTTPTAPACFAALCKNAASLLLPEGRIVTQLRFALAANACVFFRNQAANGSASSANSYQFFIGLISGSWRRQESGTDVWTVNFAAPWSSQDTWHLIRITWWRAYDTQNAITLAMMAERFTGGAWVEVSSTNNITNKWDASGINRVGVGARATAGKIAYIDDTEIWIPEP